MFQNICVTLLNKKWSSVEQVGFPLNAKKIATIECFNSNVRQFFSAEIYYYCNNIIRLLVNDTNISSQLLNSEDLDNLINILYDWIEFDEEQAKIILENAIQTELFFLLNPAKCLSMFLYKKNGEAIFERNIKEIIKEFDFFTDYQNIIDSLKNELLELANTKESLSDIEFNGLVNDVIFNIVQGITIIDLLFPLKMIQEILYNENIPLEILEIFFYENDLTGMLTKIKEYAINNERESLTYDEILIIINSTLEETIADPQAENIDISTNIEEYVTEVEKEVNREVNNIINEIEEIENVEENIEIEVNEMIDLTEIELNKLIESNELSIEGNKENIKTKNNIEIKNIEKKLLNSENDLQESISELLAKMRTEGLNAVKIETTYLDLENKFLTNFKIKLLN